jgi:putative peptidoglycan lipid II flippase
MIHRKSILTKTVQLGISALASRFFGFIREFLLARFLGVGVAADTFQAAFMVPNTLRKIFAEGALNAALTPTLIVALRAEGAAQVSAVVTMTLAITQGLLFLLCLAMSWHASTLMWLSAPGFSAQQITLGASLTQVLVFFILTVSAAATLGSALQAAQRFLMPANGMLISNILLIIQLWFCLHFHLSTLWLAYFILMDGAFIVLCNLIAYKRAGFSFALPDQATYSWFKGAAQKFIPSFITMGGVEISLVIDRILASYLPVGSISLLAYTSAFLRVPLGIFISGFATILLSRMTHIGIYAPKRIGYYLLESAKMAAWIIIPTTILMIAFSYKLFQTLLLSPTFPLESVEKAATILTTFAGGLLFWALNKILVNAFYALHDSLYPTIVTLIGAVSTTVLNLIFMRSLGVVGIALSTTVSAALQTILYAALLHYKHAVLLYWLPFVRFLLKVMLQVTLYGFLFFGVYYVLYNYLFLPRTVQAPWFLFFTEGLGFWLWVGPLCSLMGMGMYVTRRLFGIRIYFLD